MADQIQRYRPAALRKVTQFLMRTDTAHIYIPGHKLPARVEYTRPRWWSLSLLMLCAVIGTAFVIARLLAPSPVAVHATQSHTIAACVSDHVRLIVSKIKDKLQVFVDDRLIIEIKHGQVINFTGKVERTFQGPAWGDFDLSPHLPAGSHTIRLVAIHDQGLNAGAVAELRHNGRTIHVLSYPYGLHDRHGIFADQTISITMTACP